MQDCLCSIDIPYGPHADENPELLVAHNLMLDRKFRPCWNHAKLYVGEGGSTIFHYYDLSGNEISEDEAEAILEKEKNDKNNEWW